MEPLDRKRAQTEQACSTCRLRQAPRLNPEPHRAEDLFVIEIVEVHARCDLVPPPVLRVRPIDELC